MGPMSRNVALGWGLWVEMGPMGRNVALLITLNR